MGRPALQCARWCARCWWSARSRTDVAGANLVERLALVTVLFLLFIYSLVIVSCAQAARAGRGRGDLPRQHAPAARRAVGNAAILGWSVYDDPTVAALVRRPHRGGGRAVPDRATSLPTADYARGVRRLLSVVLLAALVAGCSGESRTSRDAAAGARRRRPLPRPARRRRRRARTPRRRRTPRGSWAPTRCGCARTVSARSGPRRRRCGSGATRPGTCCHRRRTAGSTAPSDRSTPRIAARSTWSPACPVALDGLRYLTVSFRGFDG